MSGAIFVTGSGGSLGSTGPSPSSPIAITSVDVVDTTPDQSGNPRKLVSVNFTPPSPVGTFAGNWVYCDMPDSAGGLSIADGTVAADGNTPATGSFQPMAEGFYAFNPASPQITFFAAAPTTPQYWRVYLCPGSASVQVFPVQAGEPGESLSFDLFVGRPATKSTGREYAPLIQNAALAPVQAGWTANPNIDVKSSGDQFFQYAITWNWPIADQNFQSLGGVNLVLSDGIIQTYIGNVSVTDANPTYISPDLPVAAGTKNYKLYLISYNTQGMNNSLASGITPEVDFTVTRSLGPAGEEYCRLAETDGVHAFVTAVAATNSSDGTALIQVDGYWQNLPSSDPGYDPQFGGAEVVVDKGDGKGPIYSVVKGTLSPIENFITSPVGPSNWAFYLRSIDINGRGNTIGPTIVIAGGGGSGAAYYAGISGGILSFVQSLNEGTGYSSGVTATLVDGAGSPIPGVSLTPVLVGGAIQNITIVSAGSGIVATPSAIILVGSSTGQLNLAKAANTSFSGQFAIVAGAFTVSALNANVITVGTLKVGNNGSGVPIELDVFDHLGSLIGWIGDDTANSGFVGGWFKQLRVGGANPTNSPIVADSSGNVTINGAPITLNSGGSTTTINNASLSVGIQALLAKNNSGPSYDVSHTDSGFFIRAQDQFTYIGQFRCSGSGAAQNVQLLIAAFNGTVVTASIGLATAGAGAPFIEVVNNSTGNFSQLSVSALTFNISGGGAQLSGIGAAGNGGYLQLNDSAGNPAFTLDTSLAAYFVTSATAGSASALPSLPAGFLLFKIGSTTHKLPFYN